jgi:hypothetical protein
MKASKLVLIIFLGFIFSLVLYLCFYSLSANHDRGTKDQAHYIPFEAPFKHLVVEDGWNLSAFIGDDPELASDMLSFYSGELKLKEIRTKLAPNGMLLTKYYPGYDDEKLLSMIQVKNDTLFFKRVKLKEPFIRSIRINLIGLSSVEVSGNSRVSLNSKSGHSTKSSFNLGRFKINARDEARVSTNWLSFDKLTMIAQDVSNVDLFWMYRNTPLVANSVLLNSDVKLSGNAVLKIHEGEVSMSDYELKDEAILVNSKVSVETVFGKKESYYMIDFNKRANASSSSN